MKTLRIKSHKQSTAKRDCNVTAGEVLLDGHLIELLADPADRKKLRLLHWDGKKATVGHRVEHGGCVYQACEVESGTLQAIRLPTQAKAHVSSGELLKGVADLFRRHLNVPQADADLLAFFSMSTWVTDCFATAPGLLISGPDINQAANALRLLHCLCRRPLMLTELTPNGFRSLPMHLHPTLLIFQSALTPRTYGLLRASSCRGFRVPGRRGGVLDVYGPKAIFCGMSAVDGSAFSGLIRLSLASTQAHSSLFNEVRLDQIANEWQPKLLMHRLRNHGKVGRSRFDVPKFTSSVRELARSLGACVPDQPELAERLGSLLAGQDEDTRAQRCNDVESAIIEAILALVHRQESREASVKDITGLTNTLLRSRGEILEYSPEEIGWKLAHLQLFTHRRNSGKVLFLCRDTSRRAHDLAKFYDVLSLETGVQRCLDCESVQAVSK